MRLSGYPRPRDIQRTLIPLLSLLLFSLIVLLALKSHALSTQSEKERDMAGIEKLHQEDIAATLTSDPDKLASLWAEHGVLLGEGELPITGRQALRKAYAADGTRVLRYKPEIRDIQIDQNTAYEWGTFDAAFQGKKGPPTNFHGRLLRVMAKQSNGSWKFVRIMWQQVK
jgi:ketosteroid isomerase-like protein